MLIPPRNSRDPPMLLLVRCLGRGRSRARVAAALRGRKRTDGWSDASERSGVVRGGPVRSGSVPRGRRSARRHLGDHRVHLGLGERAVVVAQRQPVGQALLVVGQRPAAIDVEERQRAQQRPAVAADRRLDLGGGRALRRTMTARSRSTAGWRDGGVTRRPATCPPASPGMATSATTTRSARRSSASTAAGCSSPTRPTSPPPAATRARGPGAGSDRRSARSRPVPAGRPGGPAPRGRPWRRRGRRRAPAGSRPAARPARSARTRAATTRASAARPSRRSPCRPRRSRPRDARSAGSSRPPRAGCRAGSGAGPSAGSTADS